MPTHRTKVPFQNPSRLSALLPDNQSLAATHSGGEPRETELIWSVLAVMSTIRVRYVTTAVAAAAAVATTAAAASALRW